MYAKCKIFYIGGKPHGNHEQKPWIIGLLDYKKIYIPDSPLGSWC
jgi:hypothetical protein